jgi:hypothetical protein
MDEVTTMMDDNTSKKGLKSFRATSMFWSSGEIDVLDPPGSHKEY